MSRHRAYVFTINNPTEDDANNVRSLVDISQYVIVGNEKGENGTEHYQGYVYFKEAKTFSSLKKKLPRAHIEAAVASPSKNEEYCSKQGNIFLKHGEIPRQGARSNIGEVKEKLKEGTNLRGIVDIATSYQAIRMAEIWLKYNEEERDWKPEVRWYYGSTGSGKTRSARQWLGEDIYTCLNTAKWFEGYDKHENVLIDDFRRDFAKFHEMLKILDRYPYKVETKGGSRQFLAKKIAITAPYHPKDIYETREDVHQLLRRIDEVILVGQEVN